jgi:hypothetical protein
MSEHWSLAFIHTHVAAPTVFQAVVEAWSGEIDQKLYLQPPGSLESTYQTRHPIVRSRFPAGEPPPLFDELHELPGVILYPAQNHCYLLWFPALLIHWNIFEESHRASRAQIEQRVEALAKTTDMRTVADPSSNRIIALLPRFLKQVSQVLRAEIALLLYARSPAADVVAFQFYAQGRSLDDCFARIGDLEINLIERLRQSKKLEKLLAGRFAWVANYRIH